jgi:hypothetical protein
VHDGTGRRPSMLTEYAPTCTSGGPTAAPTPPGCGARSAPAATAAATPASAITWPRCATPPACPSRLPGHPRSGR